ncbi:MAG TPA: leucine zipper domain-containing protein [Xanthobacteraceae bacterium]|nr:leucine zipper domain-containing protein [Xanthobacteraceae bacterium]
MFIHLTPTVREEMVRAVVDNGLSKAAAARQFNTTPNTVGKWIKSASARKGVYSLHDRSSRPLSSPSQTPAATCAAVENLRRQCRNPDGQCGRKAGVVLWLRQFGHCRPPERTGAISIKKHDDHRFDQNARAAGPSAEHDQHNQRLHTGNFAPVRMQTIRLPDTPIYIRSDGDQESGNDYAANTEQHVAIPSIAMKQFAAKRERIAFKLPFSRR